MMKFQDDRVGNRTISTGMGFQVVRNSSSVLRTLPAVFIDRLRIEASEAVFVGAVKFCRLFALVALVAGFEVVRVQSS